MKILNKIYCHFFGHNPIVTTKKVYCSRCGEIGFINIPNDSIIEYQFGDK